MGWNLFDDIKLGLLNLQTSIEFSKPIVGLWTSTDDLDQNWRDNYENYHNERPYFKKESSEIARNEELKKEEKKPESKKEEKKSEEQSKSTPIFTPPPKAEVKEVAPKTKVENTKTEFDDSTDFDYHNFDTDFRVFPNEEEDSGSIPNSV